VCAVLVGCGGAHHPRAHHAHLTGAHPAGPTAEQEAEAQCVAAWNTDPASVAALRAVAERDGPDTIYVHVGPWMQFPDRCEVAIDSSAGENDRRYTEVHRSGAYRLDCVAGCLSDDERVWNAAARADGTLVYRK
jgi:hypothetical protein